jgi:hypothetical protein
MQISDIFLALGEDAFAQLIRSISIGRLKSYKLYEQLKTRLRLLKLNTESLRKGVPRFWERIAQHDDELSTEIAQAILVSHLDMIKAVLDFLEIPHEQGFFQKDFDASSYLKEGWEQRVYEHFRGQYPDALVLFYINHLAWEVLKTEQVFQPAQV